MAPARSQVEPSRAGATGATSANSSSVSKQKKQASGQTATTTTTTANAKQEAVTAASNGTTTATGAQASSPGINWTIEPAPFLNQYRTTYNLDVPNSFRSTMSAAVLTAPGIGRNSPTMVAKKDKKKLTREQLALAVRKHFNSMAVNEGEVISDFVYSIKNSDRKFKMRFQPSKK